MLLDPKQTQTSRNTAGSSQLQLVRLKAKSSCQPFSHGCRSSLGQGSQIHQLVLSGDEGDRIICEPLPNLRGTGMSGTPCPNFVDHRGTGAGSRFVGAMDIGEITIASFFVCESQALRSSTVAQQGAGKPERHIHDPAAQSSCLKKVFTFKIILYRLACCWMLRMLLLEVPTVQNMNTRTIYLPSVCLSTGE